MINLLDLPTWQYALGIGIFLPLRIALYTALVSFFVFKTSIGKSKRVYRVPFFKGQFNNELKAALIIGLFDVVMLSVIHGLKLFKNNPATFLNISVTLVVLFFWTEIWYYGFHRLTHTKRFFFIHSQHHVAQVSHPLTFLSFSIWERATHGLLSLMPATLLSHFLPVPFLGVVAYQIVFISLDLCAHTNVEFFPQNFPQSKLGKLFFSPTYHAMHHARYQGNYGLFTSFMDRIFGTAFLDYPEVFNLAVEGKGPTSLAYKAPSPHFKSQKADILSESVLVADSKEEPMLIRVKIKLKESTPAIVDDLVAQHSALTQIFMRHPELARSFELKEEQVLERRPCLISAQEASDLSMRAFQNVEDPMNIGEAPLFRFKLNRKNGLSLTVHHALLDGRNALALSGELLRELAGVAVEAKSPLASAKIRRSQKQTPLFPQLKEFASQTYQMIQSPPVLLGPKDQLFGSGERIYAEDFIQKSEFKSILSNARKLVPEASSNDVLVTALHLAVQKNLSEQTTIFGGNDRISTMIPVDLGIRNTLGNHHEKFRHQTGSVSVSSSKEDRKDPTDLLKKVKARMDTVKSEHLAAASILRLRTMKNIGYLRAARLSLLKKGVVRRSHTGTATFWRKIDTILFTNVGNVRFHRSVDPWVDKVIGHPPVLPPMGVAVSVGIREEGLFLYLHASDATFNQRQADQFLKNWTERIRDYA